MVSARFGTIVECPPDVNFTSGVATVFRSSLYLLKPVLSPESRHLRCSFRTSPQSSRVANGPIRRYRDRTSGSTSCLQFNCLPYDNTFRSSLDQAAIQRSDGGGQVNLQAPRFQLPGATTSVAISETLVLMNPDVAVAVKNIMAATVSDPVVTVINSGFAYSRINQKSSETRQLSSSAAPSMKWLNYSGPDPKSVQPGTVHVGVMYTVPSSITISAFLPTFMQALMAQIYRRLRAAMQLVFRWVELKIGKENKETERICHFKSKQSTDSEGDVEPGFNFNLHKCSQRVKSSEKMDPALRDTFKKDVSGLEARSSGGSVQRRRAVAGWARRRLPAAIN
ncbi:hypothetical protein DFH09DRAFT_1068558 [Mycena vulgaris]|nr:hypothetical protein DFH09DRAFT_1068558 [Mycena vulgaris]